MSNPIKSSMLSESRERSIRPLKKGSRTKGLHAIVEHTGKLSHLDCIEIETLLRRSAEAAGATVLGANFHDFGDGMGNTGVLMLAESHISIHTWPENNYAAIDIFVCSENSHNGMESVEAAVEVLRSADRQGCFHCHVIHRAIPSVSLNAGDGVRTLTAEQPLNIELLEPKFCQNQ